MLVLRNFVSDDHIELAFQYSTGRGLVDSENIVEYNCLRKQTSFLVIKRFGQVGSKAGFFSLFKGDE
jgi:hypothetical protein